MKGTFGLLNVSYAVRKEKVIRGLNCSLQSTENISTVRPVSSLQRRVHSLEFILGIFFYALAVPDCFIDFAKEWENECAKIGYKRTYFKSMGGNRSNFAYVFMHQLCIISLHRVRVNNTCNCEVNLIDSETRISVTQSQATLIVF